MNHVAQWSKITDLLERLSLERWLSGGECEQLAEIRSARRRQQWTAGRVLAKQMIMLWQKRTAPAQAVPRATQIHIESRDGKCQRVRPVVYIDGKMTGLQLSISHSEKNVFAVLSGSRHTSVGVDVCTEFQPNTSFQRTWFTDAERGLLDCHPNIPGSVLWSLKESFFKATNRGEPFRPRTIDLAGLGILDACLDFRGANVAWEHRRTSDGWDKKTEFQIRRVNEEITTLVIQTLG